MIARARWDSRGSIVAILTHRGIGSGTRPRTELARFARLAVCLSCYPGSVPSGTTDVETRMANIKSQIKRNRQNEQRRLRNKTTRSELKTRVKRAAEGLETGADDAGDRVRAAQRRLGKAAEKGVVHKNQAARRTSRLMKRAASKG